MGFLDRFRKPEKAESQKPAGAGEAGYRQTILEIARIISDGDQEVMGEAAECVSDPKRYFEVHIDRYEERGIEDSDDLELIQWLGLVDILESRGWVCERDWKDELGDFLHFMGKLTGMAANRLSLEREWFDEDGDIQQWCRILDGKWSAREICTAALDLESDCYVLFPCKKSDLEELRHLAGSIHRRIDLAARM